ncbi:3-oxoacyl-ACP synthase III family protein [Actinosynnema sp. CS-041913]|uniref:3-oxoacyl-ACP synthase III family protein n=1 Tax=Actinosynnema sp. CS-041913 TaxID=3239917 RepID=UPI003D8A8D59
MNGSDVRILAAGSALPGGPVGNDALARRFGMDASWQQWIDVFIGTKSRHLAVDLDTGEVRTTLAELGAEAARRALEAAGVRPRDVDLVVMATATPDQLMPATVNMVAERLGVDGVPTYQLQSGCTGAVAALDVGAQLLRAGGKPATALVLGGDVCAKHFDVHMDLRGLPPDELVNVVLFGDGAGAAVLTTEPVDDAAVLHHVINRLTGLGREPGQVVEWFGQADRERGPALREDYKAIERLVPEMSVEILKELLDTMGWSGTHVDYLLPPQLSGTMTDRIVADLGLTTAEEVSCVAEIANVGNAAPFVQLERLLPEMVAGDRAIGIAVESSKWIKAGFAVGKR